MRAPAFWWKAQPDWQARLLQPVSYLYGRIAAQRMMRPGERIGIPVICIGNFIAGGAGKTPTAIAVAKMLKDMGETPAFLSRGFGGTLSTNEPLRVDPALHVSADVGDEPLMLARHAVTIICADRVAGARAARETGASVIVMDDGLQNSALAKDLALAVVDGAAGHGNGLCIPAGPLRAPEEIQWRRVQAVLVIGAGAPGERVALKAKQASIPVLRATLEPAQRASDQVRGRKVLAFAGIGRPEKFFETLRACGADIVATRAFDDHQPYAPEDLALLKRDAKACGADVIVTTEKDAVRIGADTVPGLTVLPVELALDDAQALRALLRSGLSRAG